MEISAQSLSFASEYAWVIVLFKAFRKNYNDWLIIYMKHTIISEEVLGDNHPLFARILWGGRAQALQAVQELCEGMLTCHEFPSPPL